MNLPKALKDARKAAQEGAQAIAEAEAVYKELDADPKVHEGLQEGIDALRKAWHAADDAIQALKDLI